jgi:hypothetical protein
MNYNNKYNFILISNTKKLKFYKIQYLKWGISLNHKHTPNP